MRHEISVAQLRLEGRLRDEHSVLSRRSAAVVAFLARLATFGNGMGAAVVDVEPPRLRLSDHEWI
jgi:hypothetical protein